MGYQLWTSPITGYRRRGTRLSELRALVDVGITARHILEPLQSCPADASATDMGELLGQREFDVAGVKASEDGPVFGFVTRESLTTGAVRDHVALLTPEQLLAESTPVPIVLSVLKSRQRMFVLVGPDVKGIVTRTDLNKPPLRIYLFGLVSLLEMHLSFWVRAEYDERAAREALSDGRVRFAERIQEERRSRGHETDLLDCLQMCDKRDLLLKRERVCGQLGLTDKRDAIDRLKRAEALRDLLAHGQQNLVDGSSWEGVIEQVEWMESVVHTSDALVEEKAAAAAQGPPSALLSSA